MLGIWCASFHSQRCRLIGCAAREMTMADPTDIINWRRHDQRLTSSGQPSEAQLADIKALGVTHVINLGPHTNKGALDDETGSVAALDMTYIYIPVDFDNPTDRDFELFCEAMERCAGKQVHVLSLIHI